MRCFFPLREDIPFKSGEPKQFEFKWAMIHWAKSSATRFVIIGPEYTKGGEGILEMPETTCMLTVIDVEFPIRCSLTF